MEFDLFLTNPRWEILQIISQKPSSPIEIAEKLKTTVSYVSQQLKLLDAANLLTKDKTGAFEKGKPRTLFSLSNELLYLTILTKNYSDKKLIKIEDYHKKLIKIWFNFDSSLHIYLNKLLFELEKEKEEYESLCIDNSLGFPKFLIISDSKKLKQKIDEFCSKLERKIDYNFIPLSQIKKLSFDSLVILEDKKNILNQVKGGILKKDE